MTQIQEVLWQFEMDYAGHPYYVSGNAIIHAIAHQLDYDTQQVINASMGQFTPAQFGRYPEQHSQNGTRPGMGSSLTPVETYTDFWLRREPAQDWLLDSRPRDAINTPDLKIQGGKPIMGRETDVGQRTRWNVHAYLHSEQRGALPLSDETLDRVQFGGSRNYGYGEVSLKDTQTFELADVDFAAIDDHDGPYLLKLLSPYVTASEKPHANDKSVPWWWERPHGNLRRRGEVIVEQNERYRLNTVDHGQVVRYGGDEPLKTAKKGIKRVGTHSKYGFGEFQLIPL